MPVEIGYKKEEKQRKKRKIRDRLDTHKKNNKGKQQKLPLISPIYPLSIQEPKEEQNSCAPFKRPRQIEKEKKLH